MKNILGLDLGTNSIGWALVERDFENRKGSILGMGSRIIPMSQDILGDFGKGNSVSQTAERTRYRGVRRLRERHLLRRERLHRVLNILDFLPEHYKHEIDFSKRKGQFVSHDIPKIAYSGNDFFFKDSFEEMLADFRVYHPELVTGEKKIPYDWTIYYLRKKALEKKITKEEIAWIILNFNQKRGYYQLRGEEEDEPTNKVVEYYSLKIVDVVPDEKPNSKGETWYSLVLENGWVYRRSSKTPLYDWKDKIRDFIVTTDINEDGSVKTDKEGAEKRSFRAPKDDDWGLMKKKTEKELSESGKSVGEFIYDSLLDNPRQKIRGKLIQTIERKYYKSELIDILNRQKEFHPELNNEQLLTDCIRELYQHNEAHQSVLTNRDFVHLFVNDIIFYQRPLKSKKSAIGNCTLEERWYKDENGIIIKKPLKAIPKSNPVYQEFRLWQWIQNLRIYRKDDDSDVTNTYLGETEKIEQLFEFLNDRKEIDQKALLRHFKLSESKFRWNYVEDKKYPCNETGAQIQTRLKNVANVPDNFLTKEKEQQLWHLIYSVTDVKEYEQALKTFAAKNQLDESTFVESFKKFPPFKSEYGSFSEKAIKRLLKLLRVGKYWSEEDWDSKTKDRISKIITGEYDEQIKDRVRNNAFHLTTEAHFQGLPIWLAQYIIYDLPQIFKWKSINDIDHYLSEFKQHSLRNPIVEQVIIETLRVVRDIWKKYGKGQEDFFDEIHVELGRDLKNPAKERERITKTITANENTNLRIKALLAELFEDGGIENVRPHSPMQQEALKIFEEGVLNSNIEIPDDIQKISKSAQPSRSELQRYKLWLEQKYRSPYTGQVIPLGKLFTTEYEIEHVIPQSRYFDDSFTNKVICESAINKLKDNQLGLEFILNHQGEKVALGYGGTVEVFTVEAYKDFINEHYAHNRSKRNKLLLEEIPEKMIERQMNDTRYISKFVSELMSNIVRAKEKDEGLNSKNLLPGNGKITGVLKNDWGLNDVWNDLILPRFQRMNEITNSNDYTAWNDKHQKYLPTVPLEHLKGFQKKRIDHRHHALDALIIACATRDHMNLLSNQSAKSDKSRYDLQRKLRHMERKQYSHPVTGKIITRDIPGDFIKPWASFTQDARSSLENIIVSFRKNLRVINKSSNKHYKYVEKKGRMVKEMVTQTKGDNWAIRKPLHKDTVSGKVQLDRVKLPKDKILTATRKKIDASFTLKNIESITDTGIQKILKNYLSFKGGNPEIAFSPEGLEEMNQNIEKFNDGKRHQPIYSTRVYEVGSKFPVGETGNKRDKYVEAAKGTNLFFGIYTDENGNRSYESVPLNLVIERQKQGLSPVPETNEKGVALDFFLSPNDIVYVSTEPYNEKITDLKNKVILNYQNSGSFYKTVSFTGKQCFFVPINFAVSIVNKFELSVKNKMERSLEGQMIKDVCIKIDIDRIGNLV